MCTKCLGSLEKRTASAARVAVCTRLTEKVARLGVEGRLGVSLDPVWGGDADGPNGKQWLGMFMDKRQRVGGWGKVTEGQEWGTQQSLEPKCRGSYMAGSEVHSSPRLHPYPVTGGRCCRWVPAVDPGWADSLSDSGRAAPGCLCSPLQEMRSQRPKGGSWGGDW